ncbi:hypothetical protein PLICRDRAFT_42670 [Plicaturopsis crispa FD-325 SS-3]|nr:hypothetical protein PLICRDRAFT_42670 [Plicaturopsis crispa FD-325 SS-3]
MVSVNRVARALQRQSQRFSSSVASKSNPLPKSRFHAALPPSVLPQGFLLAGVHCGVKKTAAPDLAVLVSTSQHPTSAAAVFTANAFPAAPVLVSRTILGRTNGRARAVVVNSGCANAVTGEKGLEDAWKMVKAGDGVLQELGLDGAEETLVMSTGVIGQHLPIDKIINGVATIVPTLASTPAAYDAAAHAFMTTDTFPKLRARTFALGDRTYRIAGIDKGAGMIHPRMLPPAPPHATLLAALFTDAPLAPAALQSALTHAVQRSFNAISVDGDMSTNDTVLLLANGAGAQEGRYEEIAEETHPMEYAQFRDALTDFAAELAQLVVRDGEGATKFVTVKVTGAQTYDDAHAIASKISTSALVKTALFGEDANWGRILAATGSVQGLSAPVDPARVSVSFIPTDPDAAPLNVLANGEPVPVDEARARALLEHEDIEVRVDLALGEESVVYWTCDFSYDYVKINGDYRS